MTKQPNRWSINCSRNQYVEINYIRAGERESGETAWTNITIPTGCTLNIPSNRQQRVESTPATLML